MLYHWRNLKVTSDGFLFEQEDRCPSEGVLGNPVHKHSLGCELFLGYILDAVIQAPLTAGNVAV